MSNNNNKNVTPIIVAAGVVAAVTGGVLLLRNFLNGQQQHSSDQQNSNPRNRPEPSPAIDRLNENRNRGNTAEGLSRGNTAEEKPVTKKNCDLCGYEILSGAPRQTLNCLHSFHPICYNDFRDQMCRACLREFN